MRTVVVEDILPPDTEKTLGAMAITLIPAYVFLINQTRRYQFREIVLANAIDTLADLVGKSTQIAVKEGTKGELTCVYEKRLL